MPHGQSGGAAGVADDDSDRDGIEEDANPAAGFEDIGEVAQPQPQPQRSLAMAGSSSGKVKAKAILVVEDGDEKRVKTSPVKKRKSAILQVEGGRGQGKKRKIGARNNE